jgi:hypothetical protein
MTDIGLQDALAEKLRNFLTENHEKSKWGEHYVLPNVFTQTLPMKSNEGVEDEDAETNDQWNYVCVVLGPEFLRDDKWVVEIHFSIGVKDWDEERQGHRSVCHLMTAIYKHFKEMGLIDHRYTMLTQEAYKNLNSEIEAPYYAGDLVTYWEIDAPERIDLEEFI